MIFQNVIWIVALVGMGLIALGFLYVISQASKPADDAETRKAAHRFSLLQRGLFGAFLVLFVGGSFATLRHFPIPSQNEPLNIRQVVDVVGMQWSWQITPDTVQAGSPVEFRVTSKDVNHGFAVYAPDGRIVTQVQAMPGYTNKLVHTFTQPGTYLVQCLEYCGMGHVPMQSQIKVVAARGD